MGSSRKSKVILCSDYTFPGIEQKKYKEESGHFKAVSRFALLGSGEGEEALNFHTRYFEIEPGGYSSLEHHRHPHTVVVIRGKGSVILDEEVAELNLHDVVYVAPGTIHQFQADRDDYLGFICVVDRYRDRPEIPSDEELSHRLGTTKAHKKLKK